MRETVHSDAWKELYGRERNLAVFIVSDNIKYSILTHKRDLLIDNLYQDFSAVNNSVLRYFILFFVLWFILYYFLYFDLFYFTFCTLFYWHHFIILIILLFVYFDSAY